MCRRSKQTYIHFYSTLRDTFLRDTFLFDDAGYLRDTSVNTPKSTILKVQEYAYILKYIFLIFTARSSFSEDIYRSCNVDDGVSIAIARKNMARLTWSNEFSTYVRTNLVQAISARDKDTLI